MSTGDTRNLKRYKTMFLEESSGHLSMLEKNLSFLRENGNHEEALNEAFRAIHSIKGGAGMLGFEHFIPVAHEFESILDDVRSSRVPLTRELADLALRATDFLNDLMLKPDLSEVADKALEQKLIDAMKSFRPGIEKPQSKPIERMVQVSRALPVAAQHGAIECQIRFRPHYNLFRRGHDPQKLFFELRNLGSLTVVPDFTDMPDLEFLDAVESYVTWTLTLATERSEDDVRKVFEFVEGDCELEFHFREKKHEIKVETESESESKSETQPGVKWGINTDIGPSIRVQTDRIDRLVNLAGEIAISQALVTQLIDQSLLDANPALFQELSQLLGHIQNLQDSVMSIRAQPVQTIFDRMPRLVRELSEKTGKKLILRVSGEATEIDKTVIEQLGDPIVHMMRNAADHGIEDAQTRIAAGKAEEGIISLRAEQRGSNIVIEVSDDGGGLHRDRILQKAFATGLIAPGSDLSPEEIDDLIFAPGLSTAGEVSSLSGRGVGMDVVKHNIQRLGGRVEVRSEPGKGTTFVIVLPLTLAVIDGMVVRNGTELHIIPISHIIECRNDWRSSSSIVPNSGRVLKLRGKYVRVVEVTDVLGIHSKTDDATSVAIISELERGDFVAIVVDEIVGQQQIVVKNMTQNIDPIQGISGATILGDGRVALILDPSGLSALAVSNRRNRTSTNQHDSYEREVA